MFQFLTDLFGDSLKMYTNIIVSSVVGIIGVMGFVYIFKMQKLVTLAYFKFGSKGDVSNKEEITNNTMKIPQNHPKIDQIGEVDIEEAKQECPFFNKPQASPYSNNNERLEQVDLTEEELLVEDNLRRVQLDTLFQMLKEQETARLSTITPEDQELFDLLPKFTYKKDEDEYKFSLLNQETLEYTPMEQKEIDNELESIFTSQVKLYGF